MSVEQVYARIREIQSLGRAVADPVSSPPAAESFGPALESALAAPQAASASSPLRALLSAYAPPAAVAASGAGPRALAVAEQQVGQAEQPPGSNEGPAIAVYRSAVAGAQPGEPWCADFVSWAAAQAGAPIGDAGQGLSSVAGIEDWASRTGRLLPPTAVPAPGDLILYGDRHVGIVESVNPDGSLETVEGNYAHAVSRVHRSPSEATGYVRL